MFLGWFEEQIRGATQNRRIETTRIFSYNMSRRKTISYGIIVEITLMIGNLMMIINNYLHKYILRNFYNFIPVNVIIGLLFL